MINMANYAFLDENNVVTEVIPGKDENEGGIDWEQHYGEFRGQICKRTSYNTIGGVHVKGGTPFRKNYAGIGYTYREDIDAFVPPQPYPSWALDENANWNPPIAMPKDGGIYIWNESNQFWESVNGS